MDNEIYGLTKGQTSPTSPHGHVTKSTPYGLIALPFNPIATVLSLNMSFIARGYSAKPKELASLIEQGLQHKGLSFIHVLSPCPTFFPTFDAWDELTVALPAEHDPSNKAQAMTLAMETDKLYTGLFYREERPTMDQAAQELTKQSRQFEIGQYIRRYA
jgi:2-oxoglutarate ferredoxin oxidoreductase subunit beta